MARGRECNDAVLWREPRGLQVPEGVACLQEWTRIRAVDVGTPQRVDLPVLQMHVDEGLAVGADRGIGAVSHQAFALAGAEIHSLERVLVTYEGAVLDDRRAAMEVDDVAGRVEARARVEDVVRLVLHDGPEAGAVDVHDVDVRAEPALRVRLRRERKDDRLSARMQRWRGWRALRWQVHDAPERARRVVERQQPTGIGEYETRLHADSRRDRCARHDGIRIG